MDHSTSTYLAVYLSQSSPYVRSPASLSNLHPAARFEGQVGELTDVQLVAISNSDWETSRSQIMAALQAGSGVTRIEVQQPKTRKKRGGDDF